MTQQPEPPFRVGERYENRKGLFEVLSIDRDIMTIRWDTGEKTTSSIDLQTKILRNMERELFAGTTNKGCRAPKSYGALFTGLRPEDFSDDVTGTHWRSREELGGAVTRAMDVRKPFDSWSIYKRPEVHWASITRYRLVPTWLQTKYFARINQQEMLFGLYLERSNDRNDNQDDWLRFLAWTGDSENCNWLHRTLLRTGARLINPYQAHPNLSFYGSVIPLKDGSFRHETEKPSVFSATALPVFLSSLRDDLWLNLVISRTLSRDDAIAQGTCIGSTIGDFFNTLLPVYESKPPSEA